ncbi:MAG: hypothetical protein QMD53_02105 [Actinomycetota bacterium]|nr:hypothetical protein [Actinomycetota bacterium]
MEEMTSYINMGELSTRVAISPHHAPATNIALFLSSLTWSLITKKKGRADQMMNRSTLVSSL